MAPQLSDFDFVEKIYLSGVAARADRGVHCLPWPEQAVVIAWWAKGAIDNGGFSYLYESPVRIDDIERAFREVGAAIAADACVRSKQFFPRGEVPESLSAREALIKSLSNDNGEDPWHDCDRAVWALEDFDSSVANYVRSHPENFQL
ncbi:DMP19 family protein [Luteimonas fraxinea]|uniref:DMP19 family protein n=1 Tax=Luteimonas fraxinea TaxID=2901869 RepID=A0ABS8UGX8_9GAMM|nr:DUF4375 domain-containing protein [Luteimonas fraxinea]MCD9098212.1 DMP19 family protein [Luteimonas fraxinea]MCD9126939.1 DMP19 family protein [Luteimonas fraxinea]UHH08848.1 DMP19 family protein [Luteimonas fraxinea]